jgi:phosphatidylglycerol lysyltransferase
MKFAYEKIRSFSHYKGLREYKEKFFPEWTNKYLIYEHDYDLFQIPVALTKVIKP